MGVVGLPFARALVFPYLAILLLLAEVISNGDLSRLLAQIHDALPLSRAAALTVLLFVWSTAAGFALRRAWGQLAVRPLARLPIGSWHWLFLLLPSLFIALLPVLAVLWLSSAGTALQWIGLLGLSLPIIFGASLADRLGFTLASAGAALLFVGLLATSYGRVLGYAGLLLCAVSLGPTVTLVRARIVLNKVQGTGKLAGRSILVLLVRLDLAAILRTSPWSVVLPLALTVLATLMMAAIRINGDLSGRGTLIASVILLAIVALPSYGTLEIARTALGKNLLRRYWPITVTQCGLATCGVVTLFTMPAAVAIAALSSHMGALNLATFWVFVVTQILVTAGQFAAQLRNPSGVIGMFLILLAVHVVILLIAPTAIYFVIAICASALSWMRLVIGLRRFASANGQA